MTRASTTRAWVGAVACFVTALGFAAGAPAQQEDDQDQSQQRSEQRDQDRDSQDQQQDQESQDQYQRDQQQRQSNRQNRQWNEQETSNWPEPNRDGFSRSRNQTQDQYQSEQDRPTTRTGSRGNEQDAGLGVNIISDQGPGIVVTRVFSGTPADQMGIRPGDRITQLNNQDVRSINEFISRIRNMNPGDEVELEVLRNRDERTVRGELESRQEALLLSNRQRSGQPPRSDQPWQQGDESWQTGYRESYGGSQQQGRTIRSSDYSSRLNSIEQRVSRLSRELEQIRFALQDLRQGERGFQQFGRTRESQAAYDEYQGGYQSQRFGSRPQEEQWDERSGQGTRQFDSYQDGGQQRSFDSGQRNDQSGARDAAEGGSEGPAGITGGRRTRPDSDLDRLDR